MSAAERVWIPGVGYGVPTPPKPPRAPAPQPARERVEREPAPAEPVEQLSPDQVAAKLRATMASCLDALDELKPHSYGQKISADLAWLRARARQIQRNV